MMTREEARTVFDLAYAAYVAACRKHPTFPTTPSNEPKWANLLQLEKLRNRFNRSDEGRYCTVETVQREEMLEAVTAAQSGQWDDAQAETIHLMATAMRAYEIYAKAKIGVDTIPKSVL